MKTKLTYAALLWWKATGNVTSKRALDYVQTVIRRGVCSFKRSTSLAAVRMLLGVHSLAAARTAYRLQCSQPSLGNRNGYTTIQRKILGDNRIDGTLQFFTE